MELGAKFEVEDGKGRERDEVLAKLDIDTFLIIPPKQQVTYSIIYTITFFPVVIKMYWKNVRYVFLPLVHINYRKFDSVSDTFADGGSVHQSTLYWKLCNGISICYLWCRSQKKKEIDFCFFSLGKYESEQQ